MRIKLPRLLVKMIKIRIDHKRKHKSRSRTDGAASNNGKEDNILQQGLPDTVIALGPRKPTLLSLSRSFKEIMDNVGLLNRLKSSNGGLLLNMSFASQRFLRKRVCFSFSRRKVSKTTNGKAVVSDDHSSGDVHATRLHRNWKKIIPGAPRKMRHGKESKLGHSKGAIKELEKLELCKKKILMGERCRPLNSSGKLRYDENGVLLPEDIFFPLE